MIDAVTTNKTDFFREPAHFNYLIHTALPELVSTQEAGIQRRLMAWSAGCSTGEEPYTLAMVLSEFAESHRAFHYTILATDISTRVLEKARLAIYRQDEVSPVPSLLQQKYLMRSKDQKRPLVRIVPELRAQVRFDRLNLMASHFALRDSFDLIFCRNVLIYFDRPSQERLIHQFYRHLSPGGYLVLGHSEILGGLHAQLVSMAPTVYRKSM